MKFRKLILESTITPFHKRVLKLLNKKLGEGEEPENVWEVLTKELNIDDMDVKMEILHLYLNHYDDTDTYDNLSDSDLEDIEDVSGYDERLMALSLYLDLPPVLISPLNYSHHGLEVYKDLTSDYEYAVGDGSEVDNAMVSYFDGYVDEVGIDNIDRYLLDDFVELEDYSIRQYAEETADYRIDDLDEDEVIEEAGYDKEDIESTIETLEEKINDIEIEISDLESEREDYISDNEDGDYDSEIEDLTQTIDELISNKENLESQLEDEKSNLDSLFETAKEELYDKMVDNIIEEVENEGIDYFVNNLGHSLSDAIRWYANFDESGLEQYLADNEDRGATLASYDGNEEEQFYDNEFYYIYRID
jgi:hypothetical protein